MTKRNYALIKKFEEQIAQEKKEIEEKKLDEEKEKEKQNELEAQKIQEQINNEESKEKTEREKEEERQRILLYQMLNQEEEKELQEALKQSAAIEEEKRKREIIEEEEFNRAIKQSLLESNNPPPKPEEPKKVDYQIQKNDNILYYNQPKPIQKEEPKDITPQKKPLVFTTTSNNSFQYSGLINNEEKKETKPSNIITANKGYDFQIQSNNNNFGITSQNIQEINIEDNKDINKEKKIKKEFEIKDNIIDEKKEPEIEKVEIQRKKEENKDTKPIIDYGNNNKQNLKNNINNNLIEEDNEKNENNNIIVTDEIKTKNKPILEIPPPIEEQKPSDILKNNYQNEIFMKNSKIDKIDNVYQISKGTVKIDLEEGFGSGFFLKFNLNNKPFYCLMTNEHVISSQMVLNKTKIIIKYDNEKKNITIKLNPKNRLIQCFKQSLNLDVTIVEIIPTDNITKEFKKDNFLSPKLGYDIPFIQANKKEIQIIQYPEGGELSVSEGNIMDIYSQNQNMFLHGASTKKGSSGSPIVLKGEDKVLAIHRGASIRQNKNIG